MVPALIAGAGKGAKKRFLDFFTVNIRDPNTRAAYGRAAAAFLHWCYARGIGALNEVEPVHVATYIEQLGKRMKAPSVKQHLACIRMLFDWLVTGQVMPSNPAHSVRGPRHSVSKGVTPVLSSEEATALLEGMDVSTVVGLRDRAIIAVMTYTFARVGAVVALNVEDYFAQKKRWWLRLNEKNGKLHEMPCHHKLEADLYNYLEALQAAAKKHGAALDPKAWLFSTTEGQSGILTGRPMSQPDVYRMIGRRAADAGIATKMSCHTFRATGITEYLRNGGKLEVAQQMANHESARTTGLYDRRNDQVSIDEVERILI